ncbi:MAG: cysteine synthase A, partial [Clostridia bacterium]|nr:cysteine synthase A [Clostridia bacterium]
MKVATSLTQLIGHTPLLQLNGYGTLHGLKAAVLAKLECFNPAGSVKDRAALFMLNDAERRGVLKPGAAVIEPTSGNTGIGLAAICAVRGYRLILTMPETMSVERRRLLAAYGAEIVLTPGTEGMNGAIKKAGELRDAIEGSVILGQFDNPANPAAHEQTTGPEIWNDTEGRVDIFVAGVGTGGTLTGIGRYLKAQNPAVQIVGVEPADSPAISGKMVGPHKLQGIGAGFIPANLDVGLLDRVVRVTTEQAYQAVRDLSKTEGLLVGISSGAALYAARELAGLPENEGKTVVVLLPDGGERYLSVEG